MYYNFPDHIKGDTWNVTNFTINVNDNPKDLTSATIAMKIRDRNGILLKSLSTGSGLTITDATAGKFKIDAQVLDISIGTHKYDIEITFPDGTVKTWIAGKITIIQDMTY